LRVRTKGDWSSWRLCLCDRHGTPIRTLTVQTHDGSTAFSNPTATWITDANKQPKLVVTLFLPSEGNSRAEAGTLLYVVDPNTSADSAKVDE
jgi:hypothetical protein